jgi:hypothetical protein
MIRCALAVLILAFCGCAAAKPKDGALEAARLKEFGGKMAAAFELGKGIAPRDSGFVERLEDEVLSEALSQFYSPYAGAKRLLAFRDQHPEDPLNAVFLSRPFDFEDEEAFKAGTFFNSYDKALFSPFFRGVLLSYLSGTAKAAPELEEMAKTLKLAARLTPSFAGVYPNQLEPETREEMQKALDAAPGGPYAGRLKFLLLWDERNGAWSKRREALDRQLRGLKDSTGDELLKLEIADSLQAQGVKPENAFWMSMALPGLGQVSNGELQGGLLLGGLTAAAWAWLVTKLQQAGRAPDEASRSVAYGDAAWAGALALAGHVFTAYNAAEQARFINVMVEWDFLSKPRLKF